MSSLQDLQTALDSCKSHVEAATVAIQNASEPVSSLIAAYQTPPPVVDYSDQVNELSIISSDADSVVAAINGMIQQINTALGR